MVHPQRPKPSFRNNRAQRTRGYGAMSEQAGNSSNLHTSLPSSTSQWDVIETPKSAAQLLKERVEEACKAWPFTGARFKENVLSAPFSANCFDGRLAWKHYRDEQHKSPLMQVLHTTTEFRETLIRLLFQSHTDAWSFSSTCQLAFDLTAFELDLWDINKGYYHGCENPRFSNDTRLNNGHVAGIVVVSPVRTPDSRPRYVDQITHLATFCLAASNFADYFRVLHLHRIPFLSTDILSLVIPQMRNLKTLGIYKCELIHLGHGIRLLEIIRTDKPLGKEKQVSLDWFPNFHIGPKPVPGGTNYTGSYGVTWDDASFDTRIAIWKLVQDIVPQARKQNIDFQSPQTAFRRWLEKSPCWRVKETLEAIMQPRSLEHMVSWVNFPDLEAKLHRIYEKNIPNMPQGRKWMIEPYDCLTCYQTLPGVFFNYSNLRDFHNTQSPPMCLGCDLVCCLETELDHFKEEKRHILKSWLFSEVEQAWNTDNTNKALADFELRDITFEARDLDKLRRRHGHHLIVERCHIDHETDEVQRPAPVSWSRRRGEHGLKAPEIGGKDKIIGEGSEDSQWNWFRQDRIRAHGWP